MASFRIGSVFGIPLKLDVTFLIILPLFAYLIGAQVEETAETLNRFPTVELAVAPLTAGSMPWVLGLAAAIGLFVGVVLHELGHSLVAQRYGFPIESITLWLFGGIASLRRMPEEPRQEFVIAIAGPIVSVAVGLVSYAIYAGIPASLNAVRFVFGYLALINVALAIFNMLPAFPMDGGRILRAILARNRPYAQATQIAAEVGKGFALLLGLLGLLGLNIILIGVALFVYVAASGEAQQVVMRSAFQGVTVEDLMTPMEDLHTVTPDTSAEELVGRMFRERYTAYPVVEDERLVGLVSLEDVSDLPDVDRPTTPVEAVMVPKADLVTIAPDDSAMDAIDALDDSEHGRLLVVEGGELVGLVSRTDIMTAFDIIQESGPLRPAEAIRAAN